MSFLLTMMPLRARTPLLMLRPQAGRSGGKARGAQPKSRQVGKGLTPYQGPRSCFGMFRCPDCNRRWASGNSWADFGQDCQNCHVLVYPYMQARGRSSSLMLFFGRRRRLRPRFRESTLPHGTAASVSHITPSVCGAQRSQRALKKQEGEDTLDVSKPHPQELCEKCRKLGCVPTDPTDPRPPHYESVAVPRSTRQQGRLAIAQRDFPAARFRIACSLLPEGSCVGAPCPPDITAEWTKSKSTGSVDENNCSEENVNNVGCTAALVGCS